MKKWLPGAPLALLCVCSIAPLMAGCGAGNRPEMARTLPAVSDVVPAVPACPQRRIGESLDVTVVKASECIAIRTDALEAGRENYAEIRKAYGAR